MVYNEYIKKLLNYSSLKGFVCHTVIVMYGNTPIVSKTLELHNLEVNTYDLHTTPPLNWLLEIVCICLMLNHSEFIQKVEEMVDMKHWSISNRI